MINYLLVLGSVPVVIAIAIILHAMFFAKKKKKENNN